MQNETIAVHGGYNKKEGYGSMSVPIAQTTAYAFRDSEHAANLFALKELGPIYTRLTNPTTDVLEQRYAQLEGGAAAICVASGQSAIFYAIVNVAEAGDNILISDKLYGGAVTLLTHTIKRFGIEAKIFRSEDASDKWEGFEKNKLMIKQKQFSLNHYQTHKSQLLILKLLLILGKEMVF